MSKFNNPFLTSPQVSSITSFDNTEEDKKKKAPMEATAPLLSEVLYDSPTVPVSPITAPIALVAPVAPVAPVEPIAMRSFGDIRQTRKNIFDYTLKALQSREPIDNQRYSLSLDNIRYTNQPDPTPEDIKRGILESGTLSKTLKGTWKLTDRNTGETTERDTVVAKVPYLLDNGTYLRNGTKYTLRNQTRLLPGVFTRKKETGANDVHINADLRDGTTHHYSMDEDTGQMNVLVGGTKTPIIGMGRALGATDEEMAEAWGPELFNINLSQYKDSQIDKLYQSLVRGSKDPSLSLQAKEEAIRESMARIKFDPDLMESTLGAPYTNLDKNVFLAATKKLIGVTRNEIESDDRDNLAYQEVLAPEDLFAERIRKDTDSYRRGLLHQLTYRYGGDISKLPAGALTKQLDAVLLNSGLSANPEEINALDILDKVYSTSRLGMGGIPCHSADTEVFTYEGWKLWSEVNEDTLFAVCIDGKMKFEKATRLHKAEYKGKMWRLDGGTKYQNIRYFVTPDHRMYVTPDTKDFKGIEVDPVFMKADDCVLKNMSYTVAIGAVDSEEKDFTRLTHLVPNLACSIGHIDSVTYTGRDYGWVEEIGRLAVRCGYYVEYDQFDDEEGSQYSVHIDRIDHIRICPGNDIVDESPELVDYDGYVYCASVPGELLLTRYKGRIMWSGNSVDSVPDSSRDVHPSQRGYIDPARTPESMRIGVDTYFTSGAKKGSDGQMYMHVMDTNGKESWLRPKDMLKSTVAFASEYRKTPDGDVLPVMKNGKETMVTKDKVDYVIPHFEHSFSPLANLIPFKSAMMGNRTSMGSRMIAQALPINNGEAPYVQAMDPATGKGYYDELGKYAGAKRAEQPATVLEATDRHILLQNEDGSKQRIDLDYYMPSNRKSFIHETPTVTVGQKVQPGDLITRSNQTDDNGAIALGLNANIVTMPWKGLNFEDSMVVSESFAKRMTSQHMYQNSQDWNDNYKRGKSTFMGIFPSTFNKAQLENINPEGVIKIGSVVKQGDPLILAARANTSKGGRRSFSDASTTWDHHDDGVVTDVFDSPKGTSVLVKSESQLKEGDKLCWDGRTELLTEAGWKFVYDITLDDKVACLVRDCEMEYQQPTAIHRYAVGGRMYYMDTPDINLFVTDNHNMYVREYGEENYKFLQAKDVYGKHVYYKTGLQTEVEIKPGDIIEGFIDNYQEPVYCITVPSHVVYVRRNHKCVFNSQSNRYGNKGVVSAILPDDEMPRTADGMVAEIGYSPASTISRGNPAQLAELALGKIAMMTGKRYAIADFEDIDDIPKFVNEELEKYGIDPYSPVIDPRTGREIVNDDGSAISNGSMWMMKLHHMSESKGSARGLGSYTSSGEPARGGSDGSKRIAPMHLNALIGHGAYNVFMDAKYNRGQENDDMWTTFMQGLNPITRKTPLVYRKFENSLRASGIHVKPEEGRINVMALTDSDIKSLAGNREVNSGETLRWEKGQTPVVGGLFDPLIFGMDGEKWGMMRPVEPILNPIMEKPAAVLLNLKQSDMANIMEGKQQLGNYGTGMRAIGKALADIDVDLQINNYRQMSRSSKIGDRDRANKALRYLKAAKETEVHPKEWMLSQIPILPPIFRPVAEMKDSTVPLIDDANYLYKILIDQNNSLKELRNITKNTQVEEKGIYDAYKQVTGLAEPTHPKLVQRQVHGLLKHVFGVGSSKFSIIQRSLLGTPADMVGRAVIVPDPDLNMDTIGIPEDKAWETYRPYVIHEMTKRGTPWNLAAERFRNRTPAAKEILEAEMKKRPVIADRAPVLWKGGMLAFNPIITKGDSMHLPPLVVKGFGADFDGDQQFDHIIYRANKEVLEKTFTKLSSSTLDSVGFEHLLMDKQLLNPSKKDDKIVNICHLSDFPHEAKIKESQGQFGRIDWYTVPEGVEVLSYDEAKKRLVWAPVTVFSIHHDCEIEIVNFHTGRQIFTDNDPRAVYGINCLTWEFERNTPSDALKKLMMVPRTRKLSKIEFSCKLTHIYTDKFKLDLGIGANKIVDKIAVDENFGYLLGAIIGDDWVSGSTLDRKQIFMADADRCISEKLNEILNSYTIPGVRSKGCELTHTTTDMSADAHGKSIRHVWSNSEIGQVLTRLLGHNCRNKILPKWFLNTSKNFRLGLLAGLMDTAGGVGDCKAEAKNKNQLMVNYTTTNLRLAQQIVLLAASLDISARITPAETPGGLNSWAIYLSDAAKSDLVPISADLIDTILKCLGCKKKSITDEDIERSKLYRTIAGVKHQCRLSRVLANRIVNTLNLYNLKIEHPHWNSWLTIVNNPDVTWEYIESVDKPERIETGYDLTVPGYETFANAQGIILSNTMNFHVPKSDEAIAEAREFMMPSRSLLMATDFKTPAHRIVTENAMGLYLASLPANKKRKPITFATAADARRAYRDGKISIDDPIEILS